MDLHGDVLVPGCKRASGTVKFASAFSRVLVVLVSVYSVSGAFNVRSP